MKYLEKARVFVWLLLLPAMVLSGCSTSWYLGKEVEDDSHINWQTLTADEAKTLIEKEEFNPKGVYAGEGKIPALMSPIMKVVQNQGNPDVVDVLVKYGADINEYTEVAQSKEKYTALDFALRGGYISMVQRLLELGADVHSLDELNDPPAISYAIRNDTTPETRRKIIDLLIDYGADINVFDYSLREYLLVFNPLMYAVAENIRVDKKYDDIKLISYLVSRGAEINIRPPGSALTAMHLAVMADDTSVIKELIELGGDVNLSTGAGTDHCWSPLVVYAAGGQNIDMLDWLIAEGADVMCGTGSFLEMIKLRREGKIDVFYSAFVVKMGDINNGIKFATVEEWREFSDVIMERIALLCKKQEHNICNTLEQIEKALRREAEKNRLVLREV